MSQNNIKKHAAKKKPQKDIGREIAEWVISIIIAVALALLVHNFIFQIVRVEGPSMEPTLYTDQRMFVTKFTYIFNEPKRGDIVVTHFPDDKLNYVKRIIGVGGDTIKVSKGKVYINGKILQEPYIKEEILSDFAETIISKDEYVVMGDNRNNSRDSRYISVGPLNSDLIVGKVQYVVWPFKMWHEVNHYTGYFS
jgi:signal peptidase I